jgi:histidyl-tRNA synthetase
VRGLDYYTKTVFEVWAQGIGAQNAVCGGGRYDGLAQQLGGRYTPGIGFATGMERLVLTMKHQGIEVPGLPSPQIAVVYRGQAAKVRALQLLSELRQAGLRAVMDYSDRSVKAQFRAANRAGVAYALVLGQDELASQQIVLQDMARSGPRERVSLEEIVAVLRRRLDGGKR